MQKITRVYYMMVLGMLLLTTVGCSIVNSKVSGDLDGQTAINRINDSKFSKEKESLIIWAASDVIASEIETFELEKNCAVQLEIVDINGFVPQLLGVIKNEQNAPDVILFESADLHNEAIEPYLLDLEDYAKQLNLEDRQISYAFDFGRNKEQQLLGVTFEVNPLAIYYRRSIAEEVFGTDEPGDIEALFATYSSIQSIATKLAKNNVKLLPDLYAFRNFDQLVAVNWINETGLFVIDSAKYAYLNSLKSLKAETEVAFATEWSKEWFQGMEKPISNAYGDDMQIFAYVLPSWGLSNIIMLAGTGNVTGIEAGADANADSDNTAIEKAYPFPVYNQTAGDWAVAAISNSTFLGGNYLSINKKSKHLVLAKNFLTYMVSDIEHLSDWSQRSHQLFALKDIRGYQKFEEESAFLGGQDFEKTFLTLAERIEGKTNNDLILGEKEKNIEKLFQQITLEFIQGDFHTVDEALQFFKEQVAEIYPELIVNN